MNTLRILIVEDDKGMGILLRRYLEGMPDTEVTIVEDMQSAREALEKIPPPDILTLDLILPGSESAEHSLEEIKRFKARNPNGCVVVMTGISTDPTIRDKSFLAGADHFMAKQDMSSRVAFLRGLSDTISVRPDVPKFQQYISLIETITSTLKTA